MIFLASRCSQIPFLIVYLKNYCLKIYQRFFINIGLLFRILYYYYKTLQIQNHQILQLSILNNLILQKLPTKQISRIVRVMKINKKNLFDLIDDQKVQIKPTKLGKKSLFKSQSKAKPTQNIQNPIKNKQQTHQIVQEIKSFDDFPLNQKVKLALKMVGYTQPTKIQSQSLAYSFQNNDLLCLSQTGSGKTLSFVLPILNYLCQNYSAQNKAPGGVALILGPTRQLCLQIKQYFDRFSQAGIDHFGSICIFGGVDPMKQVIQLSKKPSVIVSTPGRLLDHLSNTKGFDLSNLKFLVLDQADKLLNKDFQIQFNQILQKLPTERNAYLYSATLTHKVQKLQRVSLKNPKRIQVSQKYQTVSNLEQFYIFIPSKLKDCYLLHLLHKNQGKKTIIFAQTKLGSERIAMLLEQVGQKVQCLHGDMSQVQRIIGLQKFKKDQVSILVCTQVAARGLDINLVQLVINYDLCDPKSYVHRVGRTARIGNSGISISIVTQYDVEALQKIEQRIGQKMVQYDTNQKQAQLFLEKLQICHHQVTKKMKLKHRKSQKMGSYK